MTAAGAFLQGLGRVGRARSIVLGVWLISVMAAALFLPLMYEAIRTHLGDSLEAETAVADVNHDWMQEFEGQSRGLATTLTPSVIGFAAVLDNASAWFDGTGRPPAVAVAALAYLALLTFLSGGVIDRLARDRAVGAAAFFSACGVYFFRFVRLTLISAPVYAAIFLLLRPWLLDDLLPRFTDDLSVERTAFFATIAAYAIFGIAVALANTVFDYAKVRAVIEDRRSMVGASAAAAAFVRRNAGAVVALYAANLAMLVLVIAAYALVAPGAGHGGWHVWATLLIGQLYIVARQAVKLMFWASEAALFQSRLAHAGYVCRPAPVWPDSPLVESIAHGQ